MDIGRLDKHLHLFSLSFLQPLRTPKELIRSALFLCVNLLIFSCLWRTLAIHGEISSTTYHHLLWYTSLNQWLLFSIPKTGQSISQDIHRGKFLRLFLRPISYLGSTFSASMGTCLCYLCALSPIAFSFPLLAPGSLSLPHLLLSFPLAIASASILCAIQMCLGLCAFWKKDFLLDLLPKFLMFFGGVLLPLSYYPSWLQKICSWTPFPTLLGERSVASIYCSARQLSYLIFSYLGWGAFALAALFLTYRAAIHQLEQGDL